MLVCFYDCPLTSGKEVSSDRRKRKNRNKLRKVVDETETAGKTTDPQETGELPTATSVNV